MPTLQAKKSLPKHQRLKALMLMVASLALLGVGIFFAGKFFLNRSALEKAGREFLGSDYISRLTPQDVKEEAARPTAIFIRKINVNTSIVPVAVASDGTLQVPADYRQVGWYAFGAKPGENGTAVLTGHLDATAGPAVFWKLKNLKAGDEVQVTRGDNAVATFRVDRLEYHPQDSFPAQQVYRQSDKAELRLITCAGSYNQRLNRYSKNLVVYASLADISPKPSP